MPVRLVIRNFPPHIDAEAASAFVAQTTTRGAPVRCETLYYRRGKAKTKRGVRGGSLYVEGDNDEALAEQLFRQVTETDPGLASAWSNLGNIQVRARRLGTMPYRCMRGPRSKG